MDRACLYCGLPLTLTKKHPNIRYCSRACASRANAAVQRLPPMICAECGIKFIALTRSRKFCSMKCSGIGVSRSRKRTPFILTEYFWARVKKTDTCWLWTGSIQVNGYGMAATGGPKRQSAHRLSWELHYGPLPDGAFVCHHCDNRACVRPDHLFLGTAKDNVHDMIAKDRHSRGERRSRHKLNDDIVRFIRRSRVTNAALAVRYGVSPSVISRIRSRKNWKHVK